MLQVGFYSFVRGSNKGVYQTSTFTCWSCLKSSSQDEAHYDMNKNTPGIYGASIITKIAKT